MVWVGLRSDRLVERRFLPRFRCSSPPAGIAVSTALTIPAEDDRRSAARFGNFAEPVFWTLPDRVSLLLSGGGRLAGIAVINSVGTSRALPARAMAGSRPYRQLTGGLLLLPDSHRRRGRC